MTGNKRLKNKPLTEKFLQKFLIEQLSAVEDRLKAHFEKRLDERLELQTESLKTYIDGRFKVVDERFDQVDQRFDQADERFKRADARFISLEERFDSMHHDIKGIKADFKTMSIVVRQTYNRVEAIETCLQSGQRL